MLVADAVWADGRDRTSYRHGALPLVKAHSSLVQVCGEQAVTVKAEEYVHVIELQGDAVFEDNCFSLMPGETRTIRYTPLSDGKIGVIAYTVGHNV